MTTLIEQEASKSADHEQRLNYKIALLTKKLGECQDREKTLLRKITELEAKVSASAYKEALVKKKKKSKKISEHRGRSLIQQKLKI